MDEPFATLFSRRWGWLSITSVIFVGGLLFSVIMDLAHVHPWSDTSPDRIAWYHQEECEVVTPKSFLLQSFNFWSNFSYLAAGLLVVGLSSSHIGRAIGVVFILLSFGSGWFHGTLTEFGQTMDLVGVYAALTVLIAYAVIELFECDDRLWPPTEIGFKGLILFVVALALGIAGGFLRLEVKFFDSDYFTPFLVFILVVYMLVLLARAWDTSKLWISGLGTLGTGLLAMVFKFTDGDKNLLAAYGGNYARCTYSPHGLIQGHALWHLLSGAMFLCMFEYIRAIRSRSTSVFPFNN